MNRQPPTPFRFRLSSRRTFLPPRRPSFEAESLVVLGDSVRDDIEAMSLMLTAIGLEHHVDDRTGQVLVAKGNAERARVHWQAYRQESASWPAPPPARMAHRPGTPPTMGLMALLTLFFFHTGPWRASSPWFERGAINAEAILDQGQWWRLVTALTLHADLVHLAGNCLIGGLVIHLLCKVFGYGTGWLLLVLAGTAGNLLNIVLRQGEHFSVGLSTSVFAAIGMLTGLQLSRFRARSLRECLLPLGAGAGLLAFLGSEGARTDLGAHFFGFVVGIGLGALAGFLGTTEKTTSPAQQGLLLALALAMVVGSWLIALR